MGIYNIDVYREGTWWMVSVPQINGLTQSRHFKNVELMARELIAVSTDQSLEDVQVEIDSITIKGAPEVEQALKLREAAAEIARQAHKSTQLAVEQLRSQGMPLREIAPVVGLSYQRVAQLAKG